MSKGLQPLGPSQAVKATAKDEALKLGFAAIAAAGVVSVVLIWRVTKK